MFDADAARFDDIERVCEFSRFKDDFFAFKWRFETELVDGAEGCVAQLFKDGDLLDPILFGQGHRDISEREEQFTRVGFQIKNRLCDCL